MSKMSKKTKNNNNKYHFNTRQSPKNDKKGNPYFIGVFCGVLHNITKCITIHYNQYLICQKSLDIFQTFPQLRNV